MKRSGPRYSEAEARAAIARSLTYTEALQRLGMRAAGGNFATLRKYAEEVWNISTDHFDPGRGRRRSGARRVQPIADILVEGSSYSRGHLKRRLYKEGLKVRRCGCAGRARSGMDVGCR